jgi:hypothetical protein
VDAAVVGSGGELTAGLDADYFNVINGMWKQIFADQAGAKKAKRITITENSGASYDAQTTLGATTARDLFRDLYNKANPQIFQNGNKPVFQVTQSILNNWQDFMETTSMLYTLDRTENGSTKFSYRGIPIIERPDWDAFIKANYDNGTTLILPNRAILSDIANIPIGFQDTESLNTFKTWFENKDKAYYIDFAFKLDMKILQPQMMAVAY